MKKKIITLFLFVIMFFIGNIDAKADCICKSNDCDQKCKLTYANSCNKENLPTDYENSCRYLSKNGTEVILLYNSSTNTLISIYEKHIIGSKYETQKIVIEDGKNILEHIGNSSSGMNHPIYNKFYNLIKKPIDSCPEKIYLNLYKNEEQDEILDVQATYAFELEATKFNLEEFENYSCDPYTPNAGDDDKEKCDDLINEDLREIINYIMNIIRISVPILLIVLISYDLVSAVFADSDDKIKKAKSRTIKRIIIAIIIFFVPMLINLVFDLVNDVWNKKYEICGIDSNE